MLCITVKGTEKARGEMKNASFLVADAGCAGMTGYANGVEQQLGVVVLDPTTVTLKVCEGLIDIDLRHCKRALYAKVSPKDA